MCTNELIETKINNKKQGRCNMYEWNDRYWDVPGWNEARQNVADAFEALFDESNDDKDLYKTPWEKSNMSYDEWHKLYVKALNDSVELEKKISKGDYSLGLDFDDLPLPF